MALQRKDRYENYDYEAMRKFAHSHFLQVSAVANQIVRLNGALGVVVYNHAHPPSVVATFYLRQIYRSGEVTLAPSSGLPRRIAVIPNKVSQPVMLTMMEFARTLPRMRMAYFNMSDRLQFQLQINQMSEFLK